MKKLCALLPFVLITACATTPSNSVTSVHVNSPHTVSARQDIYKCNDNSWVHAKYSDEGQLAHLKVSMPKVSLNKAQLTLKKAAATSGVRYVNNSDLTRRYEWHTQRNQAVMSVTPRRGKTYSVNCHK